MESKVRTQARADGKGRHRRSIYVEDTTYKAIEKQAKDQGRSTNAQICHLLRQHVTAPPRKR